ncbi:FAD/NAD(P)-binding domain-containing protein [Clathrospora elynae]|uniref:FAD/NAD(P)-binding domain-containing protein n=1 Tax=Clathrospora elynae TaxID=706981 RepID=A0A6A5SL09_9PLEO|nr:FAD/NAD(P)-binding domain-containing protein [Clathrospora elynae]KAF1940833.1 FAD/NAD(P)-binding domain-containing protein [Clathrospora elynae]
MHVLIVGAGVGGLSLAQSLRKQNISFEIFERDPDAVARFQGWAIAMHSIVDDLLSIFPNNIPDLKVSTNHLAPLNISAQLSMYLPGREDRWGFQGSRIIEHNDNGVSVQFEDGSSAQGGLIVAADGINSVVKEQLLHKPAKELINVVPLATIVGQLQLSGEAFKRQLALGHSGYMLIRPDLGFIGLGGLHYTDHNISDPDHWLRKATQQEKRDHVLNHVQKLSPKFREIFEMTNLEDIQHETRVWRDLELDPCIVPECHAVFMGDAAHAMVPLRGERGYHTLVDTIVLSKVLGEMSRSGNYIDIARVKSTVGDFTRSMLKRAGQAVRNSRNLSADAQRFEADGKPLTLKMVPLPDVEIRLGTVAA